MKLVRSFFYFLGSVYLAIILITTATLIVIAGTLLESYSESHLYAAQFTYNNPVFLFLLGCFFINILVSALRRWPFQTRHIPFLITHLGLLLLLAGTMIKNIYGIQGTMGLIEGSSSEEIFTPHTEVVRIEKRNPENPSEIIASEIPLTQLAKGHVIDKMRINLVEYVPHSSEHYETWIKGKHVYLAGMKPFPVLEWDQIENKNLIPFSVQTQLFADSDPWNFYAFKGNNIAEMIEQLYAQEMTLQIQSAETHRVNAEVSLKKALQGSIRITDGEIHASLHLDYSPILGFEDPKLVLNYIYQHHKGVIEIPLAGDESLFNLNRTSPYLGLAPLQIDLKGSPSLTFIEDFHGDNFLFVFDRYGRVQTEPFRSDNLNSLYVIEEGFGGYAIQSSMPLFSVAFSRKEKEKASLDQLEKSLNEAGSSSLTSLAPPLQLLYSACQKTHQDFAYVTRTFLEDWNHCHSWLYPSGGTLSPKIAAVVQQLDWHEVPPSIHQAAQMTSRLFDEFEPSLQEGKTIMSILRERKWPLLYQLESLSKRLNSDQNESSLKILYALQEQIQAASDQISSDQLPTYPSYTPEQQARVFSAYLRSYGIHLQTLNIPFHDIIPSTEPLKLATSVTMGYRKLPPTKKIEENIPKITLQLTDGKHAEYITLAYDSYGTGLKKPAWKGKYLVRFQPQFHQIPYQVRLRDARQINYPGTNQPFSFEADLVVQEMNHGTKQEKTISMNNVHETSEGYRFYLANISPSVETAAQRIQVIVNYDPAKYFLTYPGAVCLALGIILLFWMRPYSKNRAANNK